MEDQQALDRYDSEILELPGRKTLDIAVVRDLSHRSDAWGSARIVGHFASMAATGLLIWLAMDRWWLLAGALVVHGFTIVTMFAPMHECVHKTAYRSRWLNESVGWVAGAFCFYNFHFYRRYHTWHHRYTQDAALDPELSTPKPRRLVDYIVHMSGVPFWLEKPRELAGLALGRTARFPYIPPHARGAIARSAGAQLGLYLALLAVSLATGSAVAWWYWLLPAILAQPLLRGILIVEHTGCSQDANGLTNTRTTLASRPVRFLMWNMPFHAEHHLYPSIPFYRLPQVHEKLQNRFAHVAPSYPAANGQVVRGLERVAR